MKRSKIVASLISPRYGERLDEIEGTLVALLRQRTETGLTAVDAKALTQVLLLALQGPSWGKSDRRLLELAQVLGGLVATGADGAAKADEYCAAVLGLVAADVSEAPTVVLLEFLQNILSGVCHAQGANALNALRSERPRCANSHTGKCKHSEAARVAYKASRAQRGAAVQVQKAAAAMGGANVRSLLREVFALTTRLLPPVEVTTGWYARFPAVVAFVAEEVAAAEDPVLLLPSAIALHNATVAASFPATDVAAVLGGALHRSARSKNEAVWMYVEGQDVSLDAAGYQPFAAKTFEAMAGEAKRAIETVIFPLGACTRLFRAHVAGCAASFKPLVEPVVRSVLAPKLRAATQRAIEAMLLHQTDSGVRTALVAAITTTLKEAKSSEERNLALGTLSSTLHALFVNKALKADASKIVKEHVYPALKALTPSLALYEAMGCCIKETGLVPDYITNHTKEAHSNADEIIRGKVQAMFHDIAASEPAKVKALQPEMLKLCKDSEKKIAARVGALIILSVVDLPAADTWYKTGCLGGNPHLFAIENIRKLTETWQCSCAIKACQRFLPPASAQKGAAPGYSSSVDLGPQKALLLLATHPRNAVRSEALQAIQECLAADAKLLPSFWTALLIILWGEPSAAGDDDKPAEAAAATAAAPAAKPAAKAGGKKKASNPYGVMPAGGPGKGSSSPKKDDKKAAAGTGRHPLIVDAKNFGQARTPLWKLAPTLDFTMVLGESETDRREEPAAAGIYAALVTALFAQDGLVTPDLLAEIALTAGHAAVSGPHGSFWSVTSPHLARYRTVADTAVFARLFGLNFHPERMADSFRAGHYLFKERTAVRDALLTCFADAGDREHCRAAAGRALSFLTLHAGAPALQETIELPKVEGAEKPTVLLAERIREKVDSLQKLSDLEIKLAHCSTNEAFESAVQKQLEDDDVVPRNNVKVSHNVKRDKTQKGLYSAEDEEWERRMIAKRMAEKGIEEPKVAKARADTRARFAAMKKAVLREQQVLNSMLVALITVASDSRNAEAVHHCLPSIVPAAAYCVRHAVLHETMDRAMHLLEWAASCSPVLELSRMSNTLANTIRALVEGRADAHAKADKPYAASTVILVEGVVKRIRAVCTSLLPAPSFALIFPIAEHLLSHLDQSSTFGLLTQQQMLAVVSTNCGSPKLPHKRDLSNTLMVIVNRTPTLAKTGIGALCTLAENMHVDELDFLTEALLSDFSLKREAAVCALKHYEETPSAPASTRYFIHCCTHDANRGVRRKATETWNHHELELGDDYIDILAPRAFNVNVEVCEAVSATLAECVAKFPDTCILLLKKLFNMFSATLSTQATFVQADRKGVAQVIRSIIPYLKEDTTELIIKFCVMRALVDTIEEVRGEFLNSLQKVVAYHGKEHHAKILPLLQNAFNSQPPAPLYPKADTSDPMRKLLPQVPQPQQPQAGTPAEIKESYTAAIVVVLGTLSIQMEKSDHLDTLPTKLVEISGINSPSVSESICDAMATIIAIPRVHSQRQKLVNVCMEKLLKGSGSFYSRRAQAHALAGIVKGLHLPVLHELQILATLRTALISKNAHGKEGALAAYSVFCDRLDGTYEPYVIDSIADVVRAFGEAGSVRKAAEECSAAMMKSLSHFGVRQILPPLLGSFNTENWKQKVSALSLLGQMSYCSPKQLAAALPKIVPVLCDTLNDSHMDVQKGAWDALRRVGGVISNPEIAVNSNIILSAIKDPTNHTDDALEALLYTRFTNAIDAASLSVIEPVLRRGLIERVATTKLKAAQIIGSVALLVQDKQLLDPYLEGLMVPLKRVLMDEYPDCRGTAAKTLGSLVNSMGVGEFPGLLDWCFESLDDTRNSHVERSGAAQGVAQIITAIGGEDLESYLQFIKVKTTDKAAAVREGYLQVMVYVPHALGQAYQPYLKEMTPCVVKGLSDIEEGVREMSVKAGQTVVHLFGMKCLDQLLPPLQQGLHNMEWKVRLSSLQLLGDLLMRVATENMKAQPQKEMDEEEELEEDEESEESDDEDNEGALQPQKEGPPMTLRDLRRRRTDKSTNSLIKALSEVIGPQVLGELMAAVYMLTVDVIQVVSRQAREVWKYLVDNTPAMLRHIMEFVTPKIIEYMSEDDAEHREIAGRCVGDLVSKLGDGFLPFILPVLGEGLDASNDQQKRLGSTLGLKEVVRCISRSQLAHHQSMLTASIICAIKDEDADVREEAGLAFDILFKNFGGKAIENLMKNLINAIVTNDEAAMAGTLEMVKMRPRAVLQQLIPTFTEAGVLTEPLAKGLGQVALIAEENLSPHILELVPVLSNTLADEHLEYFDVIVETLNAILDYAESEELYSIMGELRLMVQSTSKEQRKGGAGLISALVQTDADLSEFNVAFIQNVIRLYGDAHQDVQRSALSAMRSIVENLEENDTIMDFMDTVHGALCTAAMGSEGGKLTALDLNDEEGAKAGLGVMTVLTFYTKPLQSGDAEQREYAANGVLEMVEMVSVDTIKACVGDIMGPMIRKMNEVMPSSTKVAMLQCISTCIKKVGTSAKQFIVMLQNAFPKNLNNVDPDVRRAALRSLWVLMHFQEPKLDPTLNSLIMETKGAHHAIQTALLRGISLCLSARPEAELGKMVATKCADTILPLFSRVANVTHAIAVGKAVGMVAGLLDEHALRKVIDQSADAVSQGGAMVALGMAGWQGVLKTGVGKVGLYHQDYLKFVEDVVTVLPVMDDPDQRNTTMKAVIAFADHGGIREVGVTELLKLVQALVKLGETLLDSDRETNLHVENSLRRACLAVSSHLPAKYQAPLQKMATSLCEMDFEDWETSSECQDDKREDDA